MDSRVVIILPNNVLVKMVGEVVARMGLSFPIYEMQTEEALDLANKKIHQGSQIIISRGMTAVYLRAQLSVPVFEIKYDFFHFATAMRKALRFCPEICVIGFIEQYMLAERAREYVQQGHQQIHVHILPDASCVKDKVRAMGEQGIKTFVGGNLVVKTAKAMGFKAVLVEADEKSAESAIREALYELHINMEREERYGLIKIILNSASNGVFAVDTNRKITVYNPIAEDILNRGDPDWKNKYIHEIMPESALLRTLDTGRKTNDDLVQLGKGIIAVNSSPILVDGTPHGAVVTIQDADKIQKLNFKILKKEWKRDI